MKQHKIDKVIKLKAQVFDLLRKLESLQEFVNRLVKNKDGKLKELQGLEEKLINRYTRAKKLVNK